MTSIQIDIKDGLSSSVAIKGPCRVATTANITLSGEQTIDGVAVVTDDRVLVKDQTTGADNGIYIADTGAWRRSKDFNKTKDVKTGTMVNVTSGTVGAGQWQVSTTGEITIGTTSIAFIQVVQPFAGLPAPAVANTFIQRNSGNTAYVAKTVSEVRDALDAAPYVATRTALKALDTTKDSVAYLTEAGRQGNFVWTSGNFATQIAADTSEGVYVKADAIASTAGAWVRKYNGPAKVDWFGALGDDATDDTTAIQAAITLTGDAAISEGKTYRTTSTINLAVSGQKLSGKGTIHCYLGNAAVAKPAVYIDTTATGAELRDIIVDHDGSTYIDPTAHAGSLIWGSAVFVAADDAKVLDVWVKNGWDNGVAVCQFSGSTGTIVAAAPLRVQVRGVRGFNNGCGTHTSSGGDHLGACVDIGSGFGCTVSDCVDYQSYVGFILDVGASGQAVFVNCVSYNATLDAGHPTNGSGLGFYVGSSNSSFVNCHAYYAGLHGWWVDAPPDNNSYTGCSAYSCQKHGFRIDCGNAAFIGCSAKANSQAAANTYDGFALTHTQAKTGLTFHGCRAINASHRYGIAMSPTGAGSIAGEIIGGFFEGTTGNMLLGTQSVAVLAMASTGKFGIGHTAARAKLDVAGPDFVGTAVGDTTNLGQAFFGPLSAPNKRVAIGYGTGDDSGIIQAVDAGTAQKPLKLNPAGGAVSVGAGNLVPETDDGSALGTTAKRWSDAFFATGAVINYNNGNYTITHSAGNLSFNGSADFTGAVLPTTSGTPSLGSGTKMWNSLFLASGGVVNFNNGNYTVTHSAGTLTFSAGASWGAALLPTTDDGAALGSTTKEWSDLFLATGAVINFANGNYTITHTSGVLTFLGAVLTGSSLGYAAGIGSGTTVTQLTNRTTSVTINKPTGQITTNNTSLAAGATAKFTVNNSAVGANDNVVVTINSGTTTDQTDVKVQNVAAGGFNIVVANRHAATAETGAIIINFALVKGSIN